jgi:hypothetical protein
MTERKRKPAPEIQEEQDAETAFQAEQSEPNPTLAVDIAEPVAPPDATPAPPVVETVATPPSPPPAPSPLGQLEDRTTPISTEAPVVTVPSARVHGHHNPIFEHLGIGSEARRTELGVEVFIARKDILLKAHGTGRTLREAIDDALHPRTIEQVQAAQKAEAERIKAEKAAKALEP